MSIRDHIATAVFETGGSERVGTGYVFADAILTRCPEIAALDHAREGWLYELKMVGGWHVQDEAVGDRGRSVLVVPKPEAS